MGGESFAVMVCLIPEPRDPHPTPRSHNFQSSHCLIDAFLDLILFLITIV